MFTDVMLWHRVIGVKSFETADGPSLKVHTHENEKTKLFSKIEESII